jgi:hypothetical protein
MPDPQLMNKIVQELQEIPEEQLKTLYDLIHSFRLELEQGNLPTAVKGRVPSTVIAGKAQSLGDVVIPIVDEETLLGTLAQQRY